MSIPLRTALADTVPGTLTNLQGLGCGTKGGIGVWRWGCNGCVSEIVEGWEGGVVGGVGGMGLLRAGVGGVGLFE